MMTVVCLSACPIPDPNSRTEGRGKLKIGRKEDRDTGDLLPHLEVTRSRVKVTRPINAVAEKSAISLKQNRKAYELQTWYTDGVR